ncbi:unnamed protein product, partial [Lampetra planeri]
SSDCGTGFGPGGGQQDQADIHMQPEHREQAPVRLRRLPENHMRLAAPLSPVPKRRDARRSEPTPADSCSSSQPS